MVMQSFLLFKIRGSKIFPTDVIVYDEHLPFLEVLISLVYGGLG